MKICYKWLITSYSVNRNINLNLFSGPWILITGNMVDCLKRIFTFLLQRTTRNYKYQIIILYMRIATYLEILYNNS